MTQDISHQDIAQHARQLGQLSAQPRSPEEAQLDRVPNPHPDTDYCARFTAPEFTSLCPVTGQPDFAILVIDYVPDRWLVESKSLKLYLHSFRDHGAFHEDCTVGIGRRLTALLSRATCASAATGTRAAASRSTCSGRPAPRRPRSGCPTRACRPTGEGLNTEKKAAGSPRPPSSCQVGSGLSSRSHTRSRPGRRSHTRSRCGGPHRPPPPRRSRPRRHRRCRGRPRRPARCRGGGRHRRRAGRHSRGHSRSRDGGRSRGASPGPGPARGDGGHGAEGDGEGRNDRQLAHR